MAKKIISFTFINKKGITKTVHFPFDKKYYEDLFDSSVSEELRNEVLLYEYREFVRERNYHKKVISWPLDENGNPIEIADDEPTMAEILEREEELKDAKTIVEKILEKMNPKQREAYVKVHFEGMKRKDVAKEMGIKENSFSDLLKRAEATFDSLLEGKKI